MLSGIIIVLLIYTAIIFLLIYKLIPTAHLALSDQRILSVCVEPDDGEP